MIDILMPYFGDAQLARTAVESVLAQTSHDWRLVVVDDLAPDPSLGRWLQSLDHPQVEYYRNEQNLGINGNFRRCTQHLKARYATFLGCDDILGREYVALIHQAIRRHGQPAMIQPRVEIIDESGEPSLTVVDTMKSFLSPAGGERIVTGERAAVRLLHGAWTYFPAISWRRDVLEHHPFRPGLETALDLVLIVELLMEGERLLLLKNRAFKYRRHSASASSLRAADAQRFTEEAKVFAELADALRRKGWRRGAWAARMHATSRLHAASLIPAALKNWDIAAARRLAAHAFG